MPKNLIKQYIKQRELVDPEFAKDFEDGLREFKKNKDIYKGLLNELKNRKSNHKNEGNTQISKAICNICGIELSENEIDESTGECFICSVFLKHKLI
jgi:hypothetical protein